ncbi:hypothetical protein [Burkholderia pseudomallei]|uniref:hypothetical protein n=1 Tax=Burkholderia pseudomallei TaxID=28450 RepID=UPI000A8F3A18|nr:hypothetical protein [Burkholderia pseudomallei]
MKSLEPAFSRSPDAPKRRGRRDVPAQGLSQVPLVESFGPTRPFFSGASAAGIAMHGRVNGHNAANNGDAKRHNNAENWHVKPI